MANKIYQYYVEGENEERIVNTLKSDLRLICPGKVAVFDVTKRRLTKNKLMQLKQGTIVVLVFDTDTDNADVVIQNINFIREQRFIKEVIAVTQVRNLEDELVRSCDIRKPEDLTGSRSLADHKKALNTEKNLGAKLMTHNFNIDKFWNEKPYGAFECIDNNAAKIKL